MIFWTFDGRVVDHADLVTVTIAGWRGDRQGERGTYPEGMTQTVPGFGPAPGGELDPALAAGFPAPRRGPGTGGCRSRTRSPGQRAARRERLAELDQPAQLGGAGPAELIDQTRARRRRLFDPKARLRPLFNDPQAEERAYYREYGDLPLQHVSETAEAEFLRFRKLTADARTCGWTAADARRMLSARSSPPWEPRRRHRRPRSAPGSLPVPTLPSPGRIQRNAR